MEEKKRITVKDLVGKMISHIDFDDHWTSIYEVEGLGITCSVNAERKTKRNPEPGVQRWFVLEGDPKQYETAAEVVKAYNDRHFPS